MFSQMFSREAHDDRDEDELSKRLFETIIDNDIKGLKKIIKKSMVNKKKDMLLHMVNKQNLTPLLLAITLQREKIVEFLVKNDNRHHSQLVSNINGNTALILAIYIKNPICEETKIKIIDHLMNEDTVLDVTYKWRTPLMTAALYCTPYIVRHILQKLDSICKKASINIIEVMNMKDCYGNSALSLAVIRNNINVNSTIEILDMLLVYGADLNTKNNNNNNPLTHAILHDCKEVVRFLVKKNIDLYSVNNDNETAIDIASRYKRFHYCTYIHKHGLKNQFLHLPSYVGSILTTQSFALLEKKDNTNESKLNREITKQTSVIINNDYLFFSAKATSFATIQNNQTKSYSRLNLS